MAIPFDATWGTLCERCEDLPEDATLITPLASRRFRITDVQEPRIIIEDVDSGDSQPLDREQFEALAEHTHEALNGFDLDRLPPKAEPYAAVLALHPRYVLDEREGTLTELDEVDESAVLDDAPHLSMSEESESDEREEPDIDVYADMLLLIDALAGQLDDVLTATAHEALAYAESFDAPPILDLEDLSYAERSLADCVTEGVEIDCWLLLGIQQRLASLARDRGFPVAVTDEKYTTRECHVCGEHSKVRDETLKCTTESCPIDAVDRDRSAAVTVAKRLG